MGDSNSSPISPSDQSPSNPEIVLPYDLFQPIFSFLQRADWCSCCLVSKSFNRAVTPLLYQTLDSRIIKVDRRNGNGANRLDSWMKSDNKQTEADSNKSHSNTPDLVLYHPATTLLSNPHLASHVRHVTETGAVHRAHAFSNLDSSVTDDALRALSLCKNLTSFKWVDDTSYGLGMGALGDNGENDGEVIEGPAFLMRFLELIQGNPENSFPLRSLTLRTYSDLGSTIWDSLSTLSGLTRVSIWSMDGPPRVLPRGWSKILGPTLEELELGRCVGVPATILITVISQLPLLKSLLLKGVYSKDVFILLTYLPLLESLDVEYLPSQTRLTARDEARLELARESGTMPGLKYLTVRTNSRTDAIDPLKLYDWIRQLTRKEGLRGFKLHAFSLSLPSTPSSPSRMAFSPSLYSYNSFSFRELGQTLIPRAFLLDMARLHSSSLKRFEAAEAGVMMVGDVECICVSFPELEYLECAVGLEGVSFICHAIRSARNLTTLKLHIQWLPSFNSESSHSLDKSSHSNLDLGPDDQSEVLHTGDGYANTQVYEPGRSRYSNGYKHKFMNEMSPARMPHITGNDLNSSFTAADARFAMLQSKDSVLRTIGVGGVLYRGKWVLSNPGKELEFIVASNIEDQ